MQLSRSVNESGIKRVFHRDCLCNAHGTVLDGQAEYEISPMSVFAVSEK